MLQGVQRMKRKGFGYIAKETDKAVCDCCGMLYVVAVEEPTQRICDTCEAHADDYAQEKQDERRESLRELHVDLDLEDR